MMCKRASSAAATVSSEKIKIHLEDDDNSAAAEHRHNTVVYILHTYSNISYTVYCKHKLSLMLGHTPAAETNNPQQGEA